MDSRTRTRGRSGKKWVGLNFKEKESAKEANGGIMPYTLSLVTSDFPGKAEWSEMDLPHILFYIHPPTSQYEGAKVEYLIEDGEYVVSDSPDGHYIRQFEILPRNISLDVPGWMVEAWRRLDTRIGYQDILDRQYADPNLGLKKHTKNALQNHCRRECRKVLNTWVEYGRRDEPHRTEVEAIEGLSYDNIRLNTTLKPSEVINDRLVKLRLERRVEDGLYYAVPLEVTTENWRETTLPLYHFLPDGQFLKMTLKMHAAWEMYLILMERAAVHGYGHWSKLDRNCLPVTWYDRTALKSVPNDTYDGGCATCTWSLDRAIPATPDVKVKVEELSATPKGNKRQRSESREGMWHLGDTPKTPKRRYASRLSSQHQSPVSRRINHENSLVIEGVTFAETYRRSPKEYEYYRIEPNGNLLEYEGDFFADSEDDSLSNEGDSGEGSDHEVYERNAEAEKSKETPSPYAKSEALSPEDGKVKQMVAGLEANDPFLRTSVEGPEQGTNYHLVEIDASRFSKSLQYSSEATAWLRSSNILQSDPFPLDFYHSLGSSIGDKTILQADLDNIPAYLPASSFSTGHSRNTAITTQGIRSSNLSCKPPSMSTTTLPGSSFSSTDTSVSTAASSFTEESDTTISPYYAMRTPTTVGFSVAQLYPLPVIQSQAAFNNLFDTSPPHTSTYQNQMSFNSSPLRRPEPEWEWPQNRSRRYSDTDATLGLPSDFAELGAFEHDLTAISSYLGDQEFDEALELPPIMIATKFGPSHAFEGDESENEKAAVKEPVSKTILLEE